MGGFPRHGSSRTQVLSILWIHIPYGLGVLCQNLCIQSRDRGRKSEKAHQKLWHESDTCHFPLTFHGGRTSHMVNLGARGHGKYGLAVFSKRKVHYLLLHYKPSQNLVSGLKQQPLVQFTILWGSSLGWDQLGSYADLSQAYLIS